MASYDKNAAALERIIRYCDAVSAARLRFGDSYKDFRGDNDYQSCCSMYVYQIAEKCVRLSDELKAKAANIPWQKIRGLRNIFAHDYDSIKTDRLWSTMEADLPELREECLRLLNELGYDYNPEDDDELAPDDEDDLEHER
jgi:uncharacterized protein with HEPN domain